MLPRAFAAARAVGTEFDGRLAANMAVAAWLAWQDGRPDEVLRLAAEIESLDLTNVGSAAMHRWAYLFPVLAVRLAAGATAEAVAAARRIIDPSQQLLPDDLTVPSPPPARPGTRATRCGRRGTSRRRLTWPAPAPTSSRGAGRGRLAIRLARSVRERRH